MKNLITKKEEILKSIETAIKTVNSDIECNKSKISKDELNNLLQGLYYIKEEFTKDKGTLTSKLKYGTDLNYNIKASAYDKFWRVSIMEEKDGIYTAIHHLPVNTQIKEKLISRKVYSPMNNNTIIRTMKTEVAHDLMTVEDLQVRYGIGKNKAYSLIKCKDFPAFQLYGRYYIRRDQLDQWELRAMKTKTKQGGQRLW